MLKIVLHQDGVGRTVFDIKNEVRRAAFFLNRRHVFRRVSGNLIDDLIADLNTDLNGACRGQIQPEGAALALFTDKTYVPAHGRHQLFGQGEADTGSRDCRAFLAQTREGVEHLILHGGRNTLATIADHHAHPSIIN